MSRNDSNNIRCSFCGRTQDQANRMIAGNGSYICDECVRLCMGIIDEDYDFEERSYESGGADVGGMSLSDLPKPAQIRAALDDYII